MTVVDRCDTPFSRPVRPFSALGITLGRNRDRVWFDCSGVVLEAYGIITGFQRSWLSHAHSRRDVTDHHPNWYPDDRTGDLVRSRPLPVEALPLACLVRCLPATVRERRCATTGARCLENLDLAPQTWGAGQAAIGCEQWAVDRLGERHVAAVVCREILTKFPDSPKERGRRENGDREDEQVADRGVCFFGRELPGVGMPSKDRGHLDPQ